MERSGIGSGEKRIFLTGLTIFTLASLGSGLSSTSGQLIGFRVLQGIGAAMLMLAANRFIPGGAHRDAHVEATPAQPVEI